MLGGGITNKKKRKSRREKVKSGVAELLKAARAEAGFDGNFVRLAARLGWTSGAMWFRNPAIALAALEWQVDQYFDDTLTGGG